MIIWQNGVFKNPTSTKPIISGGSGGGEYKIIKQTQSEVTIAPNTLNVWDEIETLTINLQTPTEGLVNEYLIQFTSGSTPTVLNLPEDIKWASELEPQADKIYQISIVNNLAAFLEFSLSIFPQITINMDELSRGDDDLTWILTQELQQVLIDLLDICESKQNQDLDVLQEICDCVGIPPESGNELLQGGVTWVKCPRQTLKVIYESMEFDLYYGLNATVMYGLRTWMFVGIDLASEQIPFLLNILPEVGIIQLGG